jgi:hypothetical protein
MRKIIFSVLVAATALSLASAPASARSIFNHRFGFGPVAAIGLIGALVGAEIMSHECTRYQSVYDAYGNYVGRQAINIC